MPIMPAASTDANAGRGRLHSFIIAGTAAASSWLSRPSRMIVSAVAATSSFWSPLHAPSSRIAATSTVFMASMRGLRVWRSMRHREDHVQRHQRLQRVRARLDERPDVLADEAALADVDQFLGGLALLRVELVLRRHAVEILDDASAQIGAVAHLEQQAVEPVRPGGGMFEDLMPAILNFDPAVLLGDFRRRRFRRVMRQEAHHAQPVMPRRDVVDELALLLSDRAEHARPVEHLRVADLVELRAGHVDERVGVAGLELRDEPAIEIE